MLRGTVFKSNRSRHLGQLASIREAPAHAVELIVPDVAQRGDEARGGGARVAHHTEVRPPRGADREMEAKEGAPRELGDRARAGGGAAKAPPPGPPPPRSARR